MINNDVSKSEDIAGKDSPDKSFFLDMHNMHNSLLFNGVLFFQKFITHIIETEYKEFSISGTHELLALYETQFELSKPENNNSYYFDFFPSVVLKDFDDSGIITLNNLGSLKGSDTRRKRAKEFLNNSIKKAEHLPFSISYNKERFPQFEKNTSYRIPYTDAIPFLLSFVFQDGKVVENTEDGNKLSIRRSKRLQCSEITLKIVFDQVVKLFPRGIIKELTDIEDLSFVHSELYKIDKAFCLFKINNMAKRLNEILDDNYLRGIIGEFYFKPDEFPNDNLLLGIKKIIRIILVFDKGFIKNCIMCDLPDPFYDFEEYLRYNLISKERYALLESCAIVTEKNSIEIMNDFIKENYKSFDKIISEYKVQKNNSISDLANKICNAIKSCTGVRNNTNDLKDNRTTAEKLIDTLKLKPPVDYFDYDEYYGDLELLSNYLNHNNKNCIETNNIISWLIKNTLSIIQKSVYEIDEK